MVFVIIDKEDAFVALAEWSERQTSVADTRQTLMYYRAAVPTQAGSQGLNITPSRLRSFIFIFLSTQLPVN